MHNLLILKMKRIKVSNRLNLIKQIEKPKFQMKKKLIKHNKLKNQGKKFHN